MTRTLTLGQIQRVRQSREDLRQPNFRERSANLVNLSRKIEPDPKRSTTPELPIVPLAGFVERQDAQWKSNLPAIGLPFL